MKYLKYLIIVAILIGTKGFTKEGTPSDTEALETQRDLYRDTLDSYRQNDRVNLDLQELDHKRELERIRIKYEKKLAEKDQILLEQNKEITNLKKPTYKPIKVEYTGGEGLKKWTLPKRSQKKTE